MTADVLISRLDRVRTTGQQRWIARCPAHEDKGPSLAVRELDDGRTLVHCFAGCPTDSVLGAVGLTFGDLFPANEIQYGKSERRPFPAADVLRCVGFEALLCAVAADNLATGCILKEEDRARLLTAASRIQSALRIAGVSHA